MPFPMPSEPPVTSAFFPCNFNSITHSCVE
jgi:hypothetical protein